MPELRLRNAPENRATRPQSGQPILGVQPLPEVSRDASGDLVQMPRRRTQTKDGTRKALQNSAYESRVVAWLMQDGWQVFTPMLDHGHRTDILISDGPNYYRIQIKTVEAKGDNHVVLNC